MATHGHSPVAQFGGVLVHFGRFQVVNGEVQGAFCLAPVSFDQAPDFPVEGMIMAFTDSTTGNWGANIKGGGTNHVLGYYNGDSWTVLGA